MTKNNFLCHKSVLVKNELKKLLDECEKENLLEIDRLERFYKKFSANKSTNKSMRSDERKRKKRNCFLTDEEISYDLSKITAAYKGKKTKNVTVNNGILKINGEEFKKGDDIKANIMDEFYIGTISGMNFSEIIIKTRMGGKLRIQTSSLRNGRAGIFKAEK